MKTPAVLVIGRDKALEQKLKTRLVRHGFSVNYLRESSNVVDSYNRLMPDLIIIHSTRKDQVDKLNVVESLRRKTKYIPIILSTRYSSEVRAIAALRAGVNDYFKPPFSSEELLLSAKKLVIGTSNNNMEPPEYNKNCHMIDQTLIGDSRRMKEVKSYLLKVAKADSTVLITGETGTGKELAAGLIHCESFRNKKPFVSVNCAALPDGLIESELFGYDRGAFTGAVAYTKGKFELARSGSVFLDEIGDMTQSAQAKILRTIENKNFFHLGGKSSIPMKARVIAATNQNPERLVAEGNFRKDLYYRLNVARVHLPPLRKRKDDIPELANHAIQQLNRRFCREIEGLSENAMSCMFRYGWPGNVRELFNLLEAAYINLPGRKVTYLHLPEPVQNQLLKSEMRPKAERDKIISALLDTNWNKSTAAQKLNWSRMTLYRKIEKYNIVEKRSTEGRAKITREG